MVFSVQDFPYNTLVNSFPLVEKPKYARGKKYHRNYIDAVCAFDIETTNLKRNRLDERGEPYIWHQSVMYVWQFAFENFVVMGRTWKQFKTFLNRLQEELDKKTYIVIYVHNLSYEFTFLKGIYDFDVDEVFAIKSRKVLTCEMYKHFEFRCSMLQSNMSLHEFTYKMDVQHKKLKSKSKWDDDEDDNYEHFDYSIERFYFTPLTDDEKQYCINDVLGVVESIRKEMEMFDDTLYTIPLTSTGYVRRDVKKALKEVNQPYLISIQPHYYTYKTLRLAFRGGNTHANRYYICDNREESHIYELTNVKTRDMASAYPSAIINGRYPVTPFMMVNKDKTNINTLNWLIEQNKYACIIHMSIKNVRLKDKWWGCPYLSKDKSIQLREFQHDTVYDNGRILSSKHPLELYITDIDYRIIASEYDFDISNVFDIQISKYGYLPEPIKDVVRKYYKLKTELKGDDENKVYYDKMKQLLNAIYGMFAQKPVYDICEYDYLIDDPENAQKVKLSNKILHGAMKKGAKYRIYNIPRNVIKYNGKPCKGFVERYPNSSDNKKRTKREEYIKSEIERLSKKAGFPYQWGCWTTCNCRWMLEKAQQYIFEHYDPFTCYFVYCDTDSVKYVDENNVIDWGKFNAPIADESRRNNGVATDKNGVEHPLGIFEEEPTATRFKMMGAKRYVYETSDGKLHCTIAGIGKIDGAKEIAFHGGLEWVKDGMKFEKAGGTVAYYNDNGSPEPLIVFNPHKKRKELIMITSNVYLEDTTKLISRTDEYKNITLESLYNFIKYYQPMCKEFMNVEDIY